MTNMLYLISGLSGTGKTTLGRYAANLLGAQFIDQDTFYRKEKPLVVLSNGIRTRNWDCIEAIDWEKMETEVLNALEQSYVVLVGFALREENLSRLSSWKTKEHIELIYGDQELARCKAARATAKTIDPLKDHHIVEELVFPFYLETRTKSKYDRTVCVYHGDERKSIEELCTECFI